MSSVSADAIVLIRGEDWLVRLDNDQAVALVADVPHISG